MLGYTNKPFNSTIISKPALNDNNAKVFFANVIASSAKIQNIGRKAAVEVRFFTDLNRSNHQKIVFFSGLMISPLLCGGGSIISSLRNTTTLWSIP
ncbi:MAG: hypothetical protein ABSG82_03285 [Sedimentisphaerales bacterium]|jgi:hypothetical protein